MLHTVYTVHNYIKSLSTYGPYTVSRVSSLLIQRLVHYSENVLRPLKRRFPDIQTSQRGGLETTIERQLPLTNSNDPEEKSIYHLQAPERTYPLQLAMF